MRKLTIRDTAVRKANKYRLKTVWYGQASFPFALGVKDYHDFDTIQEHLQLAFPLGKIKVVEIGFCGESVGIVYMDKQCLTFKKIKNSLEKSIAEYDTLIYEEGKVG